MEIRRVNTTKKKISRLLSKLTIICLMSTFFIAIPQQAIKASSATLNVITNDAVNGDWTKLSVTMKNTSEADLMVRVGDIDNFGFGWDANFNPFSGNSTRVHNYPWSAPSDTNDATDRIMVNSGYQYVRNNSNPTDGYTSKTSRSSNSVRDIVMNYDLSGVNINNAILQMFVDDFQAGPIVGDLSPHRFNGHYTVTINKVRIPELETTINNLNQSGPIGKLITIRIPDQYLDLVRSGKLAINIDDKVSREGDGYAIDFVKLLVNPVSLNQKGTVTGVVRDSVTKAPLSGVKVSDSGVVDTTTDSNGNYTLNNIPAGKAVITASMTNYANLTQNIDVIAGQTVKLDFNLVSTVKPNIPEIIQSPVTLTNQNVTATVNYPDNPAVKQISVSKNNGPDNWQTYNGSVSVGSDWSSINDTWTVKAKSQSASGVWSDVASIIISNIDKSIPNAPILSAAPSAQGSGKVDVTATFPAIAVDNTKEISVDGGLNYTKYTGAVTIANTATIKARYKNAAGTLSLEAILNISKPEIPSISGNKVVLPDNGGVVADITVNYPNNPSIQKISIDNGVTWNNYGDLSKPIRITTNTTVLAYSQNTVGMRSDTASYKIDYLKPGTPKLSQDITGPTNGNVTVTITYPNTAAQKVYSLDNGVTWKNYSTPIVVTSNNTKIQAKCSDAAGASSDIGELTVINIDREPPTASVRYEYNSDGTVTAILEKESKPITVTSVGGRSHLFTGGGTFTFTFVDAAGNTGQAVASPDKLQR